jgi:hypothetical protein
VLPTLIHKITGPSLFAARRSEKSRSLVTRTAERETASSQTSWSVGHEVDVGNVHGRTAGAAQSLCQRGQELSVDEKEQDLFRRNDGMVCLAGSKGQGCVDILALEIWVLSQDRLSRLANRRQAQNIRNGSTQAANAWPAMHAVRVYRNSCQEIGHSIPRYQMK